MNELALPIQSSAALVVGNATQAQNASQFNSNQLNYGGIYGCHGFGCQCANCTPWYRQHGYGCCCQQCNLLQVILHQQPVVTSMARKVHFTCERCGDVQLVKDPSEIKSGNVTIRSKVREVCMPCVTAIDEFASSKP
jgi:hypothetical protein